MTLLRGSDGAFVQMFSLSENQKELPSPRAAFWADPAGVYPGRACLDTRGKFASRGGCNHVFPLSQRYLLFTQRVSEAGETQAEDTQNYRQELDT